jgi:hypothetical protein
MKKCTRLVPLVVLAAAIGTPAFAGRMDQRAADLYDKGVKLIRTASYAEGEALLLEALARGATEPNEAQGAESRYLVRRYDPYYWLGVAKMEQGEYREALRFLEVSESFVAPDSKVPVITKWPDEYRDLQKRKAWLVRELESSVQLVRSGE